MDRDPSANIIDPEERVSPSTGQNDTGESDDKHARAEKRHRGEDENNTPDGGREPER